MLVALLRYRAAYRRWARKLAADAAVTEAAARAAAEAAEVDKVRQLISDDPSLKLPDASSPAQQRAEATRRAKDDPATAALVVRRWLGTTAPET